MVVVPFASQDRSRRRTPSQRVHGSVPLVIVTVDARPPPAAAISVADAPPDRIASSAHRFPAYTGCVCASMSPGATGQVGGRARPCDPVTVGEYGGVAPYLGAGPQAADVGQQHDRHEQITCPESSLAGRQAGLPALMPGSRAALSAGKSADWLPTYRFSYGNAAEGPATSPHGRPRADWRPAPGRRAYAGCPATAPAGRPHLTSSAASPAGTRAVSSAPSS